MTPMRGVSRAPADQRHREAHQEGPDRSGQVIAGRDDDDRESPPLDEPMRNVRHHRPEAGSRAHSDQRMGGRKHGEVRRGAGDDKTQPKATAEMIRGGTMPWRSVIRPSAMVEKASAHIITV